MYSTAALVYDTTTTAAAAAGSTATATASAATAAATTHVACPCLSFSSPARLGLLGASEALLQLAWPFG